MIQDFQNFIRQNKLCEQDDKILVAVSGGIDSVVLLDLFLKNEYKVAVAHCNFSLRGLESEGDESFVRNLAINLNTEFFLKKFNTKKIAESMGLSVQETARNLRYEWFDELACQLGYTHIAVAHHFDDQAETFFINLFRGSGISGLRGMPLKRGKIIRPLLFARRTGIENYAKTQKISFREDSSNASDNYLRNRIRHYVLPEIEKLASNFSLSLNKSLEHLADDEFLLQHLLDKKKQEIISFKNNVVLIQKKDLLTLEKTETWLYYLLKDYGLNQPTASRITYALLKNEVGKKFFFGNNQLLVDRDYIIIIEKATPMNPTRKWHLRKRSISVPLKLKPHVFENSPEFILQKDPNIAYFDFEKLTFPLLIRHWKQGDRFTPFGMKGSKLISDFLIDMKVNLFEKETTYVMLSGEEIIWVIGLRSSKKFMVTAKTRKIYQVNLLPGK